MSKKPKNTSLGRQAATNKVAATGPWARLVATQQAALPVLADQLVTWNEEDILALRDALTPEQMPRFAAVIEGQLCALGAVMHKAREAALAREADAATQLKMLEQSFSDRSSAVEVVEAKLAQEQEALRSGREEVERLQASLLSREHAVDQKERDLAKAQLELDEQRDVLRQGLVQEEIAMLRSAKAQLATLRDERDKLQLAVESDRELLMNAARQDAALLVDQGLSLKAHWERLIAEVGAREAELEKSQSTLTERETRLQARRQSLANEVLERVSESVAASQADRDRLKSQLDQAYEEIQRLEVELRDKREAQRRSGGDPARLADELRKLRTQLEQREEELLQVRSSLERGDPVALKKRVDELEDRLAQRQSTLAALESEKHRWESSVVERQQGELNRPGFRGGQLV